MKTLPFKLGAAAITVYLLSSACTTAPTEPDEPQVPAPPEPAVRIIQVDAGGGHACAIDEAGRAYCWGRNDFGQLGDGTKDAREHPVRVAGVSDAVQISVGAIHTCVRHEDQTVSCWGAGGSGRTGLGDSETRARPTKVVGMARVRPRSRISDRGGYRGASTVCDGASRLEGIVDIAAGITQTCALHASGAVLCWGDNDSSQLGVVRGIEDVTCPAPVYAVEDAVDIDSSHDSTCAALASGSVRCWGGAQFGALSDMRGERIRQPYTNMLEIEGIEQATHVTMGTKHACALDREKRVWCWGNNESGTLAQGGPTIGRAQRIEGLEEVDDIDAAGGQTCATTAAGELLCWGRDVGPMSPDGPVEKPTLVEGIAPVHAASLGGYVAAGKNGFSWGGESGFACAVTKAGGVSCWGENIAGTLGSSDAEATSTPVAIDLEALYAADASDAADQPANKPAPTTSDNLISISLQSEDVTKDGIPEDMVSCDQDASFGPENAKNFIAFELPDATYTLRFHTARAKWERRRRGDDELHVTFQPIEFTNRDPAKRVQFGLTFVPPDKRGTARTAPAQLRMMSLPRGIPFDCLRRGLRSFGTVELSRLLLPNRRDDVSDGIVAGRFDLFAGSPELGRVHGRFQARDISEGEQAELNWSQSEALEYVYEGRPVEKLRATAAYTFGRGMLELKFKGVAKYEAFDEIRTRERDFVHKFQLDDLEPGRHELSGGRQVIDIQKIGIGGIEATIYERKDTGDGSSSAHPTETVPSIFGYTDSSAAEEASPAYQKLAVIVTDHLTLREGPMEPVVIGHEAGPKRAGDEGANSEPQTEWIDVSKLSLTPGKRIYVRGAKASPRARLAEALGAPPMEISSIERDGDEFSVWERRTETQLRVGTSGLDKVHMSVRERLRYPRSYVEKLAPELVEEGDRSYIERPEFVVEADGRQLRVEAKTTFQEGGAKTFELEARGIPVALLLPTLGQLEYTEGFRKKLNAWDVDVRSSYGGGTMGSYTYYQVKLEEHPITVEVVGEETVELLSGTYDVWVVEAKRRTYLIDKDGAGVVARRGRKDMQLLIRE